MPRKKKEPAEKTVAKPVEKPAVKKEKTIPEMIEELSVRLKAHYADTTAARDADRAVNKVRRIVKSNKILMGIEE